MHIEKTAVLFFYLFIFMCSSSYSQPPKLVLPIGHTKEVISASFSPDGKRILTVSTDGTAKLWDAASGSMLKDYKSGGDASSVFVTAASFGPGGDYVLINYENHLLSIWETVSGKLIWNWSGTSSQDAVPATFAYDHFSPNSKRIAMFSPYYGDTVTKTTGPVIYENKNQRPVFTLKGHKDYVSSLCFSTDGKYIVTASADSTLKTWNAANGKMIANIRFKTDSVKVWQGIPGGRSVLILVKGIARIVDIISGSQIKLEMNSSKYQDHFEYQIDNNGRYIAGLTGYVQSNEDEMKSRYEKMIIWDVHTGKQLYQKIGLAAHEDCNVFSPDGIKMILIHADSTVSISDAVTGRLIYSLKGFENMVRKAVYSANNEKILTTLSDRSLVIWNSTTGKLNPALSSDTTMINANYDETFQVYDMNTKMKFFDMLQLKNFYQPRFSQSGNIIADLRNRMVSVWDASTGKFISGIPHSEPVINDAVISVDGKQLLVTTAMHSAKLWDINTRNYISEYKGRSIRVKNAFFSKDDSKLFLLTGQGEKVLNNANGQLISDTSVINAIQNEKFQQSLEERMGHQTISPDGSLSLNFGADIVQLSPLNEAGQAKLNGTSSGLGPQNGRMEDFVYSVVFSPDSKKLLVTVGDNTTRIFDIEKDEFISTIILFDGTDYINRLSNGYYQVTPNAAKWLNYLTKDSKLISFEQLDVKYNRPDIVLKAMGNKDSALIASYHNAYIKRISKLRIDTTAFRDDYNIPEAEIVNRNEISMIQNKEKLDIHIRGSDNKYVLDHFNCWINEVPLFGLKGIRIRKKNKPDLDTTITVILSEGDNRIETSITNINGLESYRKPLLLKYVPEKAADTKVYFIGVGINEFADSNYNLRWCVQDIRDMVSSMRSKYGSNLVIVDTLFNEQATRSNIRNLKRKLFNTAVNDKVIFSYSGHGLLSKDYDYYLSSYTVNFHDPEEGGIPYDEIENMLDSIPARKKILLLDACNSGEVDKEEMKKIQTASADLAKNSTTVITLNRGVVVTSNANPARVGLQNSFELMQSIFVNVGKGTGAVIIAASAGVQFAQERSELGHGVFTYSLIEAMKNNPSLKISELKKYVGNRVIELTNGLQKPTTRNETIAVDWEVW